jgi:predicted site-specific integrase-resolvase
MNPQTLSVADAARELNVTSETIHAWRRRGWLIAHKLPNGRFVVPVSEIERLTTRAGQADGD